MSCSLRGFAAPVPTDTLTPGEGDVGWDKVRIGRPGFAARDTGQPWRLNRAEPTGSPGARLTGLASGEPEIPPMPVTAWDEWTVLDEQRWTLGFCALAGLQGGVASA